MIPDSGELLACVSVFGRYIGYIPLYILALLRSYPDAAVLALVDRLPLPPETERALDVVRGRISDRFEVAAWADRGLPPMPDTPDGRGHYVFGQSVRFFAGLEHFGGFTYGLITDVDTLHVPQRPTLLQRELGQARVLGMPYSNVVREPYYAGDVLGRMAGWHFLVVEPYFAKMQPVIERGRRELLVPTMPVLGERGKEGYDEHLLYLLVREGLGLHEPSAARPYAYSLEHSLHLGVHRVHAPYYPHWRTDPAWREPGRDLLADPALLAVLELTPPWIRRQVEDLTAFLAEAP
jgi:hypothetical protein